MPMGLYQVDPWTGETHYVDPSGELTPVEQSNAFDGRLTINQGFAINPENTFERYSIGRAGPTMVNVTEQGIIQVTSQTLKGESTHEITGTSIQYASGTFSATDRAGKEYEFEMGQFPLEHIGAAWFERVYYDEAGTLHTEYISRNLGGITAQEYMQKYPELTRILNPEESLQMGLFKYLIANQSEHIKEMIRQKYGLPADANVDGLFSDEALWLANIGYGQLDYYSSFIWR